MKPVFDMRAMWQRGLVILSLFLGLGAAQADITNFTGDFRPPLWNITPGGSGSIYFTNGDTELVLVSPTSGTPGAESLDGITYNSPLGGALRVGGTVSFHYELNAGDVQTGAASFGWLPGSEGSPTNLTVISGPGIAGIGDYTSPLLSPGTTNLSFLLDTTFVGPGKEPATLVITDFQFHDIPEPSAGVILASAVITLCAARWRRCRQQASRQP